MVNALAPIELKLAVAEASEGRDDDPINPLARATHRLMNEGQPLNHLAACTWRPLPASADLRWLGAFVWSAGQRLVFFPGFAAEQRVVSSASSADPVPVEMRFQTDHVTLDSNLKTWHITTQGSVREHISTLKTTDLGGGRVFWCGIHVSSAEVLRVLRRATIVTAEVPGTDKHRRGEILEAALHQSVCKCVHAEERTNIAPPRFFYFGLIVGPAGFQPVLDSDMLRLGLPSDLPFVQPRAGRAGEHTGFSVHMVTLNAPVAIQIAVALLPGTMTVPISFTSPARPP